MNLNYEKKNGKGIVLALDFKKQSGRPTKKRHREVVEYEEQKINKKKLCRSGLVIKCSNCGREGNNKKSCYRHQPLLGHLLGLPPIATQAGPFAGPSPNCNSTWAIYWASSTATTQSSQPSAGLPPTVTPKSSQPSTQARGHSKGHSKLPVMRSHK